MKDILALFRRDAEHEHSVETDVAPLAGRVKMFGGESKARVREPERERRPEHPVYGRR
jgi:hypothetical protein